VQVGGLARTDASGGFEAEFAGLAAELRSAHEQAAAPAPSAQPTKLAPSAQPTKPEEPAQQQAAQHRHEGE
jgi:hypothetical protein